MLHPKIKIAIDEIDAAVINGDTFRDPDERAKLLGFIARWTSALAPVEREEHCTDEEIAYAAAADTPHEMVFKHHRSMAAELQQHRARIAAHAAAHPERLSDEDIARWIAQTGGADRSGLRASPRESGRDRAVWLAMSELQQRRAADLTPEELVELKEWREELIANALDYDPSATTDTIPVIDKILAASGAKP